MAELATGGEPDLPPVAVNGGRRDTGTQINVHQRQLPLEASFAQRLGGPAGADDDECP